MVAANVNGGYVVDIAVVIVSNGWRDAVVVIVVLFEQGCGHQCGLH